MNKICSSISANTKSESEIQDQINAINNLFSCLLNIKYLQSKYTSLVTVGTNSSYREEIIEYITQFLDKDNTEFTSNNYIFKH